MTNATTTTTVKPGSYLVRSDNTRMTVQVIPTPQELLPAHDMFVIEFAYTGLRYFGRLTGRTRIMYGWTRMPTIELFKVETVARETTIDGAPSFALWGIPGDKVTGTFAARPCDLMEVTA